MPDGDRLPARAPAPVLPDYAGACVSNVFASVLAPESAMPDWVPIPTTVAGADAVVLLVLDGLGWEQLRARHRLAPTLSAAAGIERPITSVAPTTTATALTSITTGRPPSQHGVLGYRMAAGGEILNVLRWTIGRGEGHDARRAVPARGLQPLPPFPGTERPVPVVSRDEFGGTGFTAVHLGDAPLHGYKVASSLPVEVDRLVRSGETVVYAYYDGMDKVAHSCGLDEHYDAELRATDGLVADLLDRLPSGTVVAVTADHGQIDIGLQVELLGRDLMNGIELLSGEGRFRWLHARPGAVPDLVAGATERYGDTTWVVERDRAVDEGWFGGALSADFVSRIGDVALVPYAPIAFVDPADTGESRLQSRHGSLTPDEVHVPLLVMEATG
ncbi:MAG: alkaline phosphatase family protein [Acidimicrobiales bacterium]|nr:alkaline phosphatase family protein [Acidimicrobiales bacterium]